MKIDKELAVLSLVTACILTIACLLTGDTWRVLGQFVLSLLIGFPVLALLHRRDKKRHAELLSRLDATLRTSQELCARVDER